MSTSLSRHAGHLLDPGPVPRTGSSRDPGEPAAVDLRGLTKRYGRRVVLDGLDMRVPDGAIAGFVGPNGAGKTTTLRILLGLVRPNAGGGRVLGEPLAEPARYLSRVGALIESPAFYPALSGERNLAALAELGGHARDRVGAALDRVGLADRAGDPFRSYSLGMKQRLGIAGALLGDPDLLVLDEPTNGLDPSGIRQMRDLLRSLGAADGPTVLVSSHLLAEMEQICDWLVVVERGRLAYCGPADRLMAAGASALLLRPEQPEQLDRLAHLVDATLADWHGSPAAGDGGTSSGTIPMVALRDGARIRLTFGDTAPDEAAALAGVLNRAAHHLGITLVEISNARASLEERYSGLVAAGGLPSKIHQLEESR
jgi:ABC-2 type transport system ATP-binding protein